MPVQTEISLNYGDIVAVAQEAAAAAKLPIEVAFVYLNCKTWEISFRETGKEARRRLAAIPLHCGDRTLVRSDIEHQLLQHYFGKP